MEIALIDACHTIGIIKQQWNVDVHGAYLRDWTFYHLNCIAFSMFESLLWFSSLVYLFYVLLPVNNKWKALINIPARAITVFGYHHSHCLFPKASLVIFTGFANIFFVNMELICVFLVDLVIVIQLGICNDGWTEIEYYQIKWWSQD